MGCGVHVCSVLQGGSARRPLRSLQRGPRSSRKKPCHTVRTRAPRETTPLQTKLEIMAGQIGAFGLAAALFSLIAMAGQFSYAEFVVAGRPWSWDLLPRYLHFVITAITIVARALRPSLRALWA